MNHRAQDEKPVSGALLEAWRADTASTAELSAGYRRFLQKSAKPARAPRIAVWLLAGAVLGGSLAQAASALPARWFHSQQPSVVRPPARALVGAPLAPRVAVMAPASSSVESEPSREPEPSLAPAPSLRTLEPRPSLPTQAVLRTPSVSSTRNAAPSAQPTAPYLREQWQQVAVALRSGDFARAESALLEVERIASGGERDAARLSRAQLLSSHGRRAEALQLAIELETRAQSRLVREQALELRARLSQNDQPTRSTPADAAIKQP